MEGVGGAEDEEDEWGDASRGHGEILALPRSEDRILLETVQS
jgi:hypothetical protein